jgi:hypothetical protein
MSRLTLRTHTFGAIALISTSATTGSAAAGGVTWDGDCGNTFWNHVCGLGAVTNWNDDNIPTLGDNVSLPLAAPTVSILNNAAANTISCLSGLNIQGGALQLAGGGVIHNLSINSIAVEGLRVDAGEILLETSCQWTQGRMAGAGSVKNRGLMTGSPQVQGSVTFFNQATANLLGMVIGSNAAAVNGTGASMTHAVAPPLTMGTIAGPGQFTNLGTLISANHPTSVLDITAPFLQHAPASMQVTGAVAGGGGTRFQAGATFDGGTLTVGAGSRLHFRHDGGGTATYTFNGLPAITGAGNAYVEIQQLDLFRIDNDLLVNLTGADGFVMTSGRVHLTGVLTNQGKALWNGAKLDQANCGGDGLCSPEFRNQGTLRLFSSGVTLDTWLTNQPGALAAQEGGNLSIGNNGVLSNYALYQHYRGNIQRVSGATFGSFVNNDGAYYERPSAGAQDVTISAPFVLNEGSTADFYAAITTFAGSVPNNEGIFFQGGDFHVWDPAIVRIATGRMQENDQTVIGDGQFRIGGSGGNTDFIIEGQESSRFFVDLGPDGGLGDAAAAGGFYLDVGGHIGGIGTLENVNTMYLNGGTVGVAGIGRLDNSADCFIDSSFGVNGFQSLFVNQPGGIVQDEATITINGGLIDNRGDWYVAAPITIQSFGPGVFENREAFIGDCGPPIGNTVTISARFDNRDLVYAKTGTLNFTGNVLQVSGGTLAGGTWVVDNGAGLDLPGTLTTIGEDAEVILDFGGNFNDLRTITANNGHLVLDDFNFLNSWSNFGWVELEGPGTVEVQNGNGNVNNEPGLLSYFDFPPVIAFTGPESAGNLPFALRCANFNNRSTVRPGGPGAPGPFKMDGNFNQSSANAVLQIELAGETAVTEHDQLLVDGNVLLDGRLQVRVLPGYFPEGGEQFTIIAAANGVIAGAFDFIDGPGQYSLSYSPTSVTLTLVNPPNAGDVNGDGETDVDDLVAIIIAWGACPPAPTFCAADLTGDGFVDIDDLLTVIINWG